MPQLRQGRRRPTMIDVAEVAGVSHQTVSRYLRTPERLKPDTFGRVERAIAQLNYRPNLLARSMRTRRTGMLAIVMPGQTVPYSPARILASATAEAHAAGFQVEIVSVEGGAAARTTRVMELISGELVEAVLSLAALDDRSDVDALGVVEVEECYDDHLNGAGVLLNADSIPEILGHLASLGHRSFLHIGGPWDHPASNSRRDAYTKAIEDLGLESAGVTGGSWDGLYARDVVASLPDDSPVTAIVAGNDELAAGVISGAIARGWSVPGRISVTGWDDNPLGALMPPTLSTVRVDHASVGRAAMKRLIAAIRDEEVPVLDPVPLNTVIWRDSVAPPVSARS